MEIGLKNEDNQTQIDIYMCKDENKAISMYNSLSTKISVDICLLNTETEMALFLKVLNTII